MRRIPQAIPFHRWQRGKWGGGRLDFRQCWLCGRFEIVGYGNWHKAERRKFPDAVFSA